MPRHSPAQNIERVYEDLMRTIPPGIQFDAAIMWSECPFGAVSGVANRRIEKIVAEIRARGFPRHVEDCTGKSLWVHGIPERGF